MVKLIAEDGMEIGDRVMANLAVQVEICFLHPSGSHIRFTS